MTRSAIELLFRVLGPLAMLPEAYPRKPGMSDPDWRDELIGFARGHCTDWMRVCLKDPEIEHQLRVYHAGPFLTPPHRLEPARDVLWTTGWSGGASPRPRLLS